MDFPAFKKPKSKKLEGVNSSYKKDELESAGKMKDEVPSSNGYSGDLKISANKMIDDSALEGANSLADKSLKAIGADKSDKAEAIRARAMLVKAKSKKLEEFDEDSMQAESPRKGDYDSYTKEKGYFKKK